eukprot:TRINITY_DN6527_c0_g1_i1.p1 TRINITY_DN6527_c0_g1~~TRINITY_DN6527_c0_g1_i1.p1  ORF type:complete len:257 (-),score=61.27 TRINITY_DN6527_c0_g1_i1:135-905(-)
MDFFKKSEKQEETSESSGSSEFLTQAGEQFSIFGEKMKEGGSKLLLFSKSAAQSAATTTKVVADHVKGRVAPTFVSRTGLLMKFGVPDKWTEQYSVLKDGVFSVLDSPSSEQAQLSIPLVDFVSIELVDEKETKTPHSFKITTKDAIVEEPTPEASTTSSILSFSFGKPKPTSSNAVPKAGVFIFAAHTQEEAEGWVRDLSSVSDGVKFKEKAKEVGTSTINMGSKIGNTTINAVTTGTEYVGSKLGFTSQNSTKL